MNTANLMIFKGPGLPLEEIKADLPLLKEGEILIRNRYTTICGSDLHTYCGVREEACPSVLGHEIVGEVAAIGEGHNGRDQKGVPLQKGDLVTWSIFSSDPASYYSQLGMPQKGERLFKYGHATVTENDAFHGGLAEYCVLKPGTSVLKIPAALPLPVAATINCALSTVAGALRMAGDLKGKTVAVFGMGLLGLTCAAMCREAGASHIVAADINQMRLEQSLSFGADETVLLSEDHTEAIRYVTGKFPRKGADVVFDMSGSRDAMETGLEMLSVGGTAVWIGAVFKSRKVRVDPEKIIRNLLVIKGLHNYNYEDFVYALDFIAENWKKYAFDTVVEKEFSLSDANEAFQFAIQEKPLRVGITI